MRLCRNALILALTAISIHAPLAGCDGWHITAPTLFDISIHAPLAGCDCATGLSRPRALHFNPRTPCGVRLVVIHSDTPTIPFQSTHPLRGATKVSRVVHCLRRISIHAPLAGCDSALHCLSYFRLHFNPRTPCGVRLLHIVISP